MLVKIVFLAFAAFIASTQSLAQQSTDVPRVGFIMPGPGQASMVLVEEFRQGLRDMGYVDGRSAKIDIRFHPADRPDLLIEAVDELVRAKPDVLVGPTTPHIMALKQATGTIPIVMVLAGDPVGTGFVENLARPGGNITGLSIMQHELMGKRLEILKEIFPRMSRVASLRNPGNLASQREFKLLEAAARPLGVALYGTEVRDPTEFSAAFAAIARTRADALIVQAEQLTWAYRKQIADLAIQNRLPTLHYIGEFVQDGGLLSYGANLARHYRRSATYVAKILRGAKPAELPVEQPTEFELIINLKTAKALGITIPEPVLLRADKIIR